MLTLNNNDEKGNELIELMTLPGFTIGEESVNIWQTNMKICMIISGNYGEKILENLINRTGHCKVCSTKCIGKKCKYGKYSFAENISVIKIPSIYELPEIIEEPEQIIGEKLPKADIVIATGLHNDIYLALPEILQNSGIKALLILRKSPQDAPLGVSKEVEGKCKEFGIEFDNPKPPCLLTPKKEKPIITKFIREYRVGIPVIKVKTAKNKEKIKIRKIELKTSAPCGATWYIARMLLNYEINLKNDKSISKLCEYVASLNQSYCIASTAHDYELGDTVIHWATYIAMENILRALNFKEKLEEVTKERTRRKLI